jgi:hypothetical protein
MAPDDLHSCLLSEQLVTLRVAAALLLLYWHRNDEHVLHWMCAACADIVFEFHAMGVGCQSQLRKFGLVEDEESLKKVLGLSALGKCTVLLNIASTFEAERGTSEPSKIMDGFKDVNVQMTNWNAETITRYLSVGKRLQACPEVVAVLKLWEYSHGRDASFDGITALRSLVQVAGGSSGDMHYVCVTLYKEQLAGIRRLLTSLRSHSARYDVPRVLKALLCRRDLFFHIKAACLFLCWCWLCVCLSDSCVNEHCFACE